MKVTCHISVSGNTVSAIVQTASPARLIIRAIDPDSKGEVERVPGNQGTWDSLHFENVLKAGAFIPFTFKPVFPMRLARTNAASGSLKSYD